MRRKSREIVIFNLSMMDVVTGAMGAFLIVMVILARYYESTPENKENIEALQTELRSARDRLRDIDQAIRRTGAPSGDIVDAITRADRNLSDAEQDAEDLREQLDQADQELERKDEIIDDLALRRGFNVASSWRCAGVDVDIYVWDTQTSAIDDSPAPAFDPNNTQWTNWNGSGRFDFAADGIEAWYVGSSTSGADHHIYIKAVNPAALSGECLVTTVISHEASATWHRRNLSRSTPWALLSIVSQDNSLERGDFIVRDPTEEELAAARNAIAGG